MSDDCSSIDVITAHELPSNPYDASVYPIARIVSRTRRGMSRCAFELISPATIAMPVVHMLSHATRLYGSCSNMPSRTASLIWSHILSGWPSVTDSDVNMNRLTFASLVAVASSGSCGAVGKAAVTALVSLLWDRRLGPPRLDRGGDPPARASRAGPS